jgi:3-oxoacyl-[acyl-carrier protein] reductase
MLKGKNALITGASRKQGIGFAIAKALAEWGANVYLTTHHAYDATMPWGKPSPETDEILADLRAFGVEAQSFEVDLSDPASPKSLFDQLPPIDVLVNNAAYSVNADIDSLTSDVIDRHYEVNMRGTMLLCAEFVRRWDKKEGGRIINMSSGQGYGPMPGELPYVATKGAIEAFTVSLSAEVMSRGITVNAIDPGATDTGWIPPDLYAIFEKQSPRGRVGMSADAAKLVRFLASPESEWITGQIIRSRGGV